jgi:riboflavin biosynthesis pyrimidine reductase
MTPRLSPFQVLFDRSPGRNLPLPTSLRQVYGDLRWPRTDGTPHVFGNFALTLDGVAALQERGTAGGGEITGFDCHDRWLMGLLRALADFVVVGAGTVRSVPRHVWTAAHVAGPWASHFEELRRRTGRRVPPVQVVVTSSGRLDPTWAIFQRPELSVWIVTPRRGADRLRSFSSRSQMRLLPLGAGPRVPPRALLTEMERSVRDPRILVEGGPHLMADFLAASCVHELFLTLAPQIAGRTAAHPRLGLAEGRLFGPHHPLWGSLWSLREADDRLFLRYGIGRTGRTGTRRVRVNRFV